MTTKRPHYRTKAEWAAAQARALRDTARQLQFKPSAGSYARAARKGQQLAHLDAQAARYERMALRFRDKGL